MGGLATTVDTAMNGLTVQTGGSVNVVTVSYDLRVFSFVYQWLIMPFIIILNLISIAVCSKSHSQTLRMRANKFVVSLAVADLFIGLMIPYYSIIYIQPLISYSLVYCGFRVCINLAHCMASVLSIFLVTVDRYVAVIYPLAYHRSDSKFFDRVAIVAVWAYSIFSGFIPFLWNKGTALGCSFITYQVAMVVL